MANSLESDQTPSYMGSGLVPSFLQRLGVALNVKEADFNSSLVISFLDNYGYFTHMTNTQIGFLQVIVD